MGKLLAFPVFWEYNLNKGNFDVMQKQVKSKQRVKDKGEVFTNEREVNAMLDLVKQETERIDNEQNNDFNAAKPSQTDYIMHNKFVIFDEKKSNKFYYKICTFLL